MYKSLFFIIILYLVMCFSGFSQEGQPADTDSIDAHYFEEAYFWQSQNKYLCIFRHDYYTGVSHGPYPEERITRTYYVYEINRTTGEKTKSSITPSWVKSNLKNNKLTEINFIDTDYESGAGAVWNIGPHKITEKTHKNLRYDISRFYDGYQGDIICIEGMEDFNGIAGYWNHTAQTPALFKPEPIMNYWELNKEGYLAYNRKDYATAVEFFLKSLEINPDFQHSNYNIACMYSLLRKPFSTGKKYLEKLLNDPELKAYYAKKIPTDTDLDYWRTLKEFTNWFAYYK